jgi:tetratricopeptide (TPR) repeat protein
MNNHEKARDYAKQAAKIFREINCGYLKPLYSYVIALNEVHDNPESLAPMLEAIDVSREFGTREWTWQIQFELARLYKQAGDISNSVKYCRESINTLKEITESFDNSEQISSYLQVPLRAQVFDFVKSLKS